PDWMDKLRVQSAEVEAAFAAAARARAERRERRLAEGPAVYCGELQVRPVMRGMELSDLHESPDVRDWLADVLGLDDLHGDAARVRLPDELLPAPHPPTEAIAPGRR